MPWPEVLIEAWALGTFMVSACLFGTWLEHPDARARRAIPSGTVRRALMGVAMGLTAVALIYSPWGMRSGAHMNPAVTLTFWYLGRVPGDTAIAYVLAQCVGAVAGVALAAVLLGGRLAHPDVGYVVTSPGRRGIVVAFAAEVAISLVLMFTVLTVSSSQAAMATGLAAGLLVFLYILLEAPLSGMSMNPARTLGSAAIAGRWMAAWIYFVAPPLGMLGAAELHQHLTRGAGCAKLCHSPGVRCLFCGKGGM